MRRIKQSVAAVVLAALASSCAFARDTPQGTSFTYQGVLKLGGVAVNQTTDLRFSLYDAASAGAQLGSTIDLPATSVNNGNFTVDLDFGALAIVGSKRWLEIQVRVPAGSGSYQTLAPRQAIAASPYALHALNAGAVAAGGLPSGGNWNLTSGLDLDGGTLHVDPITHRVGFGTSVTTDGDFVMQSAALGDNTIRIRGQGPNSTDGKIKFQDDAFDVSMHNNASGSLTIHALRLMMMGGAVGIGTNDPHNALSVVGWESVSLGFVVGADSPNTQLTVVGNADVSGNIGIGTTFPNSARLQIVNNSGSASLITINTGVAVDAESSDPAAGAGGGARWEKAVTGATRGVYARSDSTAGNALYAWAPATSGNTIGAYGRSDSPVGAGVIGELTGNGAGYGVQGVGGPSSTAWAVYGFGRTGCSGTKAFRIDDPRDPANKYLLHYSAEGPDPLNIYSGTAVLDRNGTAWVQLPDYFDDINRDPRIHLTPAGAPMPDLYASEEVVHGRFQIAGGKPGRKVYWEVKAIRNDKWVQRYAAPVETEKPENERGLYQHPELYDQPANKGTGYARRAESQGDAQP